MIENKIDIENLTDEDILNEIKERDLESDIIGDMKEIKDFSDKELIEEIEDRNLKDEILEIIGDNELIAEIENRRLQNNFTAELQEELDELKENEKNFEPILKDLHYIISIVDAIENNRSQNIPLDCYEIKRHIEQAIEELE